MLRVLLGVLLAAVVAGSGCASIGYSDATQRDVPLRRARVTVPTDQPVARIEQAGDVVVIQADRLCEVRDQQTVRRTTTSEAYNGSPATDWLYGGAAVATGATGTILLIDAGSTYESDRTSRTYNSTGPGKERVFGVGFLVAALAMAAIPIVDAIRANTDRVTVEEANVLGEELEPAAACAHSPIRDEPINGEVAGRSFLLGATDRSGRLTASLRGVIPESFVIPFNATTMTVKVGNTSVGTLDLQALRDQRRAAAWARVGQQECREAVEESACEGVETFLARYQDGPEATEARNLLGQAGPQLDALLDNNSWDRIEVTACTQLSFEFAHQVQAACQPLVNYLQAFPDGLHAQEAQRALERGHQRAEAMERERQRQQQVDERREAEQERRQCVGVCRVMCSQIQFRGDPQGCLSGCLAARCEQ